MSDTYLTRESLIWRVKDKGDQEAWEEFIALYKPFVQILIYKLSVSKSNVDDIEQEDNINSTLFNDKNNDLNHKEKKVYTSINDYKPTGNIIYKGDMFDKIEKKINK